MIASMLSLLMFALTASSVYGSSMILELSVDKTLVFIACASSIISIAALIVNVGILSVILYIQNKPKAIVPTSHNDIKPNLEVEKTDETEETDENDEQNEANEEEENVSDEDNEEEDSEEYETDEDETEEDLE